MNGGEEECMYDICGKARRKENTGKTKIYMLLLKWILEI
jgi:hypothetical protein